MIQPNWKHVDASTLTSDFSVDADVAVIGTGAGGGVSAEILSRAGLQVVLVEEGPFKTSKDFHGREAEAYPDLYQESAGRKTKDKGIAIYQGRSVGGSTTVNWTTSFRTPPMTLRYWQQRFGLKLYSEEALAPWFATAEQRFNILPWAVPPNENNRVLAAGASKLGISHGVIARNVKGCGNLGYCGMGCPLDAKQSMLVTTIPSALEAGATILSRTRAWKIVQEKGKATHIECQGLSPRGTHPSPHKVIVRAKVFILSAGAIGTPALLLRSSGFNRHGIVGARTFLHPVSISAAVMPDAVDAHSGAPQSVYSDHFLFDPLTQPDAPVGFKLEVPPVHPVLMATNVFGHGPEHLRTMAQFPFLQVMISLLRDGFHEQSQGGQVELRSDGTPVLNYELSDYLWEGIRRSLLTMGEIQFAAGAKAVHPLHENARPCNSFAELKATISQLPMRILSTKVVSAHVMGGCPTGADEKSSVVDEMGELHATENVFVFDGSVFPTSIGANPQLSIYGIASRNASALAAKLTGKTVGLAVGS